MTTAPTVQALAAELREHIATQPPSCNSRVDHLLRRAARALAPTVVRCGERTWPRDPEERRPRFTDCFDDDQLCRGCYCTIHPGDQERLFEHDQSADPSDDGAAP